MLENTQDPERLSTLLEEGLITEKEYTALRNLTDPTSGTSVADTGAEDIGVGTSEHPMSDRDGEDRTGRIHPAYWLAGVAGGLGWFFGKEFGLVAWVGAIVAAVVLGQIRLKKGRWMAWVALALSVIYACANVIEMGHVGSPRAEAISTPTTTIPAYPTDSWGMTVDEMKALWNRTATERMNLAHLSIGKLYTERADGPHGLDDVWYTFDDGSRFSMLADRNGWVYEVGVAVAGEPHPLMGQYFIQQIDLLARTMHYVSNAPNDVFRLLGLDDLDNWKAGYWKTAEYRDATWEVLMLNEGVAVAVYPQRSTLFPQASD